MPVLSDEGPHWLCCSRAPQGTYTTPQAALFLSNIYLMMLPYCIGRASDDQHC